MPHIVNVILSGGVGSRLWPLSRKDKPKQYLDIFDNQSLFSLTIDRNKNFVDNVLVVTNASNLEISKSALKQFTTPSFYVIESAARNTAAAIALACLACDENAILIVSPSDHIIKGEEYYSTAVKEAISLAEADNLVTFGINPTKPETGYGYIEYQDNNVLSFREKPNKETAEDFLKSGRFMWNSGMFCFKAKVLLEELKIHDKKLYTAVVHAWNNRTDDINIPEEYMNAIPSRSIDYSVMEKSKKIKMVKSNFYWSDLGSFDALYDYLVAKNYPIDEHGNMFIGNNYIYTEFVGMRNTILVHTDDALLVLNKDNSQDVKKVYDKLEKNNANLA